MAYLTIEDFKAGLDRRRMEEASAPGSLQQLKNAHINRGGEIEKAKAWVSKYTLPAGTMALAAVDGELIVFGSATDPGVPVGVIYQQLVAPDGDDLVSIDTFDNYSGQVYVVGTFSDGLQYHFLDGTEATDWRNGLIRPGHADWDSFLDELADQINLDADVSASHNPTEMKIRLTARALNDPFTVTVEAENGGAVDDQTITTNDVTAASATDAQVTDVLFAGTLDDGDKFTVTIGDNYYGAVAVQDEPVVCVKTHKTKVYAEFGVNLGFSGVAEPTKWRPQDVGSGVIDMSAQSSSDDFLTGMGIYQNNMAYFSPSVIQVWFLDTDPDQNTQLQVISGMGTRSRKTIKSFGDNDTLFLSDYGIRSLRARDSSNSAGVTDVGTPIDDIIIAHLLELGLDSDEVREACSEIEPNSGRYIMNLEDIQYVFSYFPSSKISAWSTWEPGFGFSDFATKDGRLYGRDGDTIYLLGGDNNDEYTEEEVTVIMPYLDARQIATWKQWKSIDVVLEGVWDIYINTNPRTPDVWVKTARVTGTSIGKMKLGMYASAEMMKFKFVHQGEGAAKISKIIVHYEAKWSG